MLFSTPKKSEKIYQNIISKVGIDKKEFLKVYRQINCYYFKALNSYKNYKKFIKKENNYFKKCFFAYLTAIEIKGLADYIKAIQEVKNFSIQTELKIEFLEAINEALSKDKYDPSKCKSLDYFLFGVKIKTKNGKIIRGYVEKDFLDWFQSLFRKKKKENVFYSSEYIENFPNREFY